MRVISGANTSAISTSSTQAYDGAFTLGANTNLTGSTVTFGSTVNADAAANNRTLTVTGNAVLGGVVGGTQTPSTVHVTGTTADNTSAIGTTSTRTPDTAKTLRPNTT